MLINECFGRTYQDNSHALYCPDGSRPNKRGFPVDLVRTWGLEKGIKEWFIENCQSSLHCNDWDNERFYCDYEFGCLGNPKYKPACIIHDMCYETGRRKEACDREMSFNLQQMGCNRSLIKECADLVRIGLLFGGKTRRDKTCSPDYRMETYTQRFGLFANYPYPGPDEC